MYNEGEKMEDQGRYGELRRNVHRSFHLVTFMFNRCGDPVKVLAYFYSPRISLIKGPLTGTSNVLRAISDLPLIYRDRAAGDQQQRTPGRHQTSGLSVSAHLK